MTRKQVELLTEKLPPPGQARHYFEPWDAAAGSGLAELNSPDIGIRVAERIARSGEWPPFLDPAEYRHLKSAVALLAGGDDEAAPAVRQAREIMEDDSTADLAQALLLVGDSTVQSVAKILGVEEEALAAYEALYFNVKDRSEEFAYLKHLVASSHNPQLLETGLNGSSANVLCGAGWIGLAYGESPEELDERIRLDALAAAAAWMAGDSRQSVPPLVARGLAVVRIQTPTKPPAPPPHASPGILSAAIAATMEDDLARIRADFVARAQAEMDANALATPDAPTP